MSCKRKRVKTAEGKQVIIKFENNMMWDSTYEEKCKRNKSHGNKKQLMKR